MGVSKQKTYTKEFKLSAVKLSKDLGSVAEAARKIGITAPNLYNWRAANLKNGEGAFPGKGKLNAEDEKLRQLENENRKLKLELEFLKKAATYFAAHQK